jgi:serine/threonine protein phosphatase PrpC
MRLRYAGVTDTGRRRRRNEDSYVLRPPLFAVADGMGGAQAGELASRIAVEAMGLEADGRGEDRVNSLIQEANRRVYERAGEDSSATGMGTTMTAAIVGEDGLVTIGHVGDSRAYLLREGRFEQLTEDHSLVAELVRTGKLSEEEAEDHPQRSVITRALGTDPSVDVDVFTLESRPGDVFLICSDGLTTMVADEEIGTTIEAGSDDLEGTAKALVRKANKGGGEDNITVVVFQIPGEKAPESDTAVLPAATEESDDDDDTLTELDAVPPVDTMVVPPEQVHAVARPTYPDDLDTTARRVLAIMALVALVVVAVAFLIFGLSR